jgi:hypothetical protein
MGFLVFSTTFIPSNLIEITEEFVRAEGGSEDLTVRTVRWDAICYLSSSGLKAFVKTIIDKRILNVKTFEETVEV